MPVREGEKEIELVVTWICNWNCEYCCVDTHNRKPMNFEEVKEKLKLIPEGYNVTISGGEPGAMTRENLEYIIEYLEGIQCVPSINTNGTFLRKYPDLIKRFDTVLYHCSENIDIADKVLEGDYDYLLIVTDNNFEKLADFLDYHKDKVFSLVAATNPEDIHNPTLSITNKHKMLKKYHKRMTRESIMRVFKEKDFDSIIYI